MSRQLDKQVNASLQTILDAANDLITEVGIPATAIDLIEGPTAISGCSVTSCWPPRRTALRSSFSYHALSLGKHLRMSRVRRPFSTARNDPLRRMWPNVATLISLQWLQRRCFPQWKSAFEICATT